MAAAASEMRVTIASLEIPAPEGAALGALVVAPVGEGAYPGLLFYTDIFGRNPASVRTMMRFAGYGYTVVSPDLYRRIEPLGVALDFITDYDRAQRDANATTVAQFDADRALAIAAMRAHPRVDAAPLCAVGFCIGGHLALRAASHDEVRSIVAYYPTGIHDGALGASRDVDTLAMLTASAARLYVAFGSLDPHTDEAGRERVAAALGVLVAPYGSAAVNASATRLVTTFAGEHAFMRDEGPRYDPEIADRAFEAGVAWMRAGA